MTVKNLIRLVVLLVLILLPLAVWWCCLRSPPFPRQLVIATGRVDGRYAAISQALAERIETELEIPVRLLPTNGSLDNLHHVQRQTADFALYQPGTREALDEHVSDVAEPAGAWFQPQDAGNVAFVANVYSQPAHFIVRREAGITGPADLKGKHHRVSLGLSNSGDLAMSLALLDHFNLDRQSDIDAKIGLDYVEIERLFQAGELDAAFITVGAQADVFRRIAEIEACQFLAIANVEALLRNNLYVSPYTVPRGLYRFDPPVPEEDVPTVAATAQLLTRTDLPRRLIEAVTGLIHDEEFIKENRLWELSAGGREYALAKPEFPLHPGARAYYYPELRPLLDPGFVESWEGMISLACSAAIGLFFVFRWLRKERDRRKDHRLDRFIHSLLDIERRQMPLDESESGDDVGELQRLLDEVTLLRQEALSKFTAHHLNEDCGADCFIHMCHALSDKINAKLTRQQQNRLLRELTAVIQAGTSNSP